MQQPRQPLFDRLSTLPISGMAGAVAALVAMGTVLLHMVGALMHVQYLSFWGIDADLFPKSTEWTLLRGYYGVFERFIAILSAVRTELLVFFAAAVALALYFAILFNPQSFGAETAGGLIERLPARGRGFVRRLLTGFMLLLLLPCLMLFLVVPMGALGAVGETAGRALAERNAEDFRRGCDQSKAQCIELRRDGIVFSTGYLLDSSVSHIAVFDVGLGRARALPRDGIEMVTTRQPW